jgi:3-hydroxy-5-methyl-1-naphthoate 3-O-methyltransferase
MREKSHGLSYLMDLIIGSSAGAVLAAAVDLDVFPLLSSRPEGLTSAELGENLDLDQRSCAQLLTSLACLGLVVTVDDRHRPSELSASHLLPEARDYLGGYVGFVHKRSWEPWGRLTDHLRGSVRPAGWGDGQETVYVPDDEVLRRFWSGIHPASRAAGRALPGLLEMSGQRRVLDVGGGTGGFAIGLCQSADATATARASPTR